MPKSKKKTIIKPKIKADIKSKTDWVKWSAIGTLLLAIVAIISLGFSFYSAKKSFDLSEKLIDITPPNYPEIDARLVRVNDFFLSYENKTDRIQYQNRGQIEAENGTFMLWTYTDYAYQYILMRVKSIVPFDSQSLWIEFPFDIDVGVTKWFLKIKCQNCNTDKCYSFYICTTNSTYTPFDCDKEHKNWLNEFEELDSCNEPPYIHLGYNKYFD